MGGAVQFKSGPWVARGVAPEGIPVINGIDTAAIDNLVNQIPGGSAVQKDIKQAFVDLLDRVVNSDKVLLCFQMFIGGGAFASPVPQPPVNSICNRDVVLGIVFDCFYEPGGEAEAEGFQQDMQNLLADYSGTQEIRMLWGTFGDTHITDPAIRKLYYDDVTWKGLQQLKQQVDAGDLFHTRFTVQLP